MSIYLMDDMAFVDLGKGYLLCIGSKAEIDNADEEKIRRMITEAVAYSKFRSITRTVGKSN